LRVTVFGISYTARHYDKNNRKLQRFSTTSNRTSCRRGDDLKISFSNYSDQFSRALSSTWASTAALLMDSIPFRQPALVEYPSSAIAIFKPFEAKSRYRYFPALATYTSDFGYFSEGPGFCNVWSSIGERAFFLIVSTPSLQVARLE
jgi:hypothetical protein